jgi:prepilin-type N-terminal cleavage/methylation domain-containing protein
MVPSHSPLSRSFTLVELLAVIAIMAVLIAGAIYYSVSYVQWAKLNTDHEIYAVLNDEVTRYKSGGGNMAALTIGAPINDIFAALQNPVVPAGMPASFLQQFMPTGYTYPGRSLSAIGSGQQYCFTRVNTYQIPAYSSWYSATTTGGSTGTIAVHVTVQSSGPPWGGGWLRRKYLCYIKWNPRIGQYRRRIRFLANE